MRAAGRGGGSSTRPRAPACPAPSAGPATARPRRASCRSPPSPLPAQAAWRPAQAQRQLEASRADQAGECWDRGLALPGLICADHALRDTGPGGPGPPGTGRPVCAPGGAGLPRWPVPRCRYSGSSITEYRGADGSYKINPSGRLSGKERSRELVRACDCLPALVYWQVSPPARHCGIADRYMVRRRSMVRFRKGAPRNPRSDPDSRAADKASKIV